MPMTIRSVLFLVAFLAWAVIAKEAPIPKVDEVARVKQHRRGASGDLVAGEEHMRKLLLQWDTIADAVQYEVCHNCEILPSGEVVSGDVSPVPPDRTRSGRPVFVFPNAPMGANSFHVRVSVEEGKWGQWSDQRNFYIDPAHEGGDIQHEEL